MLTGKGKYILTALFFAVSFWFWGCLGFRNFVVFGNDTVLSVHRLAPCGGALLSWRYF